MLQNNHAPLASQESLDVTCWSKDFESPEKFNDIIHFPRVVVNDVATDQTVTD